MKNFTYTVTAENGIHARPAGMLVKTAKEFSAKITLEKDGKTADAKKLIVVMSLNAKQGDTLSITADGEDEEVAIEALQAFFKQNL